MERVVVLSTVLLAALTWGLYRLIVVLEQRK